MDWLEMEEKMKEDKAVQITDYGETGENTLLRTYKDSVFRMLFNDKENW